MPQTEDGKPKAIRLDDYAPPAFLIDQVSLDVSLHPTRTKVRARSKFRRNPASAAKAAGLRLDGEFLELEQVRLDGRVLATADYTLTSDALIIAKVPDDPFSLDITTYCNPEANKALQGLYRSRGIYCTQCEAEGFRRITYFLDRPDVLSRYSTRIEADPREVPVLLGNGNLAETGVLDRGKRHYAVWKDPHPKPAYLFALVGGDLRSITSSFKTRSGRKVDLGIYVEPGKEDRCGWAMESLKRSMRWDEERFGREYDLDVFNIVAVSDFNMGAMENKGLNIFNDRLVLATPETATDATYERIEAVIAHEYFHNWTGNRITCRDWFQLCLKEGLTVYRDQEFTADERDRTVERITSVIDLKARQFPEDAGPLAHPVRPDTYIEINNFYTPTVYEKGAELVRMIETIVGPDGFRRGMDLYFERHDGEAATVEQFVACFEAAAGADLRQFMTWYAQAGTPELVCKFRYDPRRKIAELAVEQVIAPTPGEPRKKPLHIPVRIGLVGPNGGDMPLRLESGAEVADGILHLRKRSEVFRFVDVASRPVPSLLRGFSAPVNLSLDLDDQDLVFLMAHDSDRFNRWQAANSYAMRLMVAAAAALRAGRRPSRPTSFISALSEIVRDERLDPSYRALMLQLPAETDVARVNGRNVDPALIHRARRAVIRAIAAALAEPLEAIYQAGGREKGFKPDADSAGRRSLRNAVLALLTERGRAADIARAESHFRKADNLTDEIAGLTALAGQRGDVRDAAFARFHQRWKGDHLVIDHWFSLQAASPLPTALRDVERLGRDPLFSLQNPNKVRALYVTFAQSNPVGFNRPDGRGYELIVDKVLAIDGFNPQIAARLLGSFRSWRALEPERRKLARRAIARVLKADELSRDTYEIASRMLEER
ncbi:MAG TPA: aminopeptidase N [Hyphomicrobiaceae bacterium]|nr:aminopeptidase N [Hyphomicrobiaceae bacterium]